ncbi:MAG: helix-turn-helix domain-containing protein [Haloarculaceae archaeon]
MAPGIRVELKVEDPPGCTVAAATGSAGSSAFSVEKAVNPDAPETVTEEFATAGDLDSRGLSDDVDPVFEYGEDTVYRFERDRDRRCPCEVVEAHDCPVVDVHTRESDLYVTFHAPAMDRLQAVVGELRESYPSLSVQRLLRNSTDTPVGSPVLVDRDILTDRQREVLETAHTMGYFEHPKEANAGEVAPALGISSSTFAEHLAAAQRKLLDAIVDD